MKFQIAADFNHILEMQFLHSQYTNVETNFPWLIEWLRVIGVEFYGNLLISRNHAIKVREKLISCLSQNFEIIGEPAHLYIYINLR